MTIAFGASTGTWLPFPRPRIRPDHEYPVTEIVEVLGEYPELIPSLGCDLEVRLDAGSSAEASALHSAGQGGEQLDVLGRVGRERLDVAIG